MASSVCAGRPGSASTCELDQRHAAVIGSRVTARAARLPKEHFRLPPTSTPMQVTPVFIAYGPSWWTIHSQPCLQMTVVLIPSPQVVSRSSLVP